MTKIEDMSRTSIRGTKDFLNPQFKHLDWREQRDGIEISLHRVRRSHLAPTHIERLAPIQTDHVGAGRCHLRQQSSGFHAEVDHRALPSAAPRAPVASTLQKHSRDSPESQRTDPAVENLDHVRACLNLQPAVLRQHDDHLVQQARATSACRRTSSAWCRCNSAIRHPRSCSWPACTALRRSRSHRADRRNVLQLFQSRAPHRQDRRRDRHAQRLYVLSRAHRLVHHRAFTRLKFKWQAPSVRAAAADRQK